MSTASTSSVYIVNSLSGISQLPKHIQWLAVAPKDQSELIETLIDSLEGKPAAILALPELAYEITSLDLQTTIEKSVASGSITHVVLVGSSQRGPEPSLDDDAALPQHVSDVANHLVLGAAHQSFSHQTAQAHFKQEINQFLSSKPIQPLCNSQSMVVFGLLYRQCDGAFVLFDHTANEFTPLALAI